MSQNLITKTITQQQTLFSLNLRTVNDLFPGFSPGDFAVVHGSPSMAYLTSLLCVRAQLPTESGGLDSNVVFVDGGNSFSASQIAHVAEINHVEPKQASERIFLFRAFTAYQITTLIMKRLKAAVEKYNASLVVISGLTGLFLNQDIPDEEAERFFRQVVAYLQNLAREKQIVVVATCPSRRGNSRSASLQTAICEKAGVVIGLCQTMCDSEFVLEKHSRFMLGDAEFPLENLTLMDFVGQ
jgi:predicted ATP-dependent serine protease